MPEAQSKGEASWPNTLLLTLVDAGLYSAMVFSRYVIAARPEALSRLATTTSCIMSGRCESRSLNWSRSSRWRKGIRGGYQCQQRMNTATRHMGKLQNLRVRALKHEAKYLRRVRLTRGNC